MDLPRLDLDCVPRIGSSDWRRGNPARDHERTELDIACDNHKSLIALEKNELAPILSSRNPMLDIRTGVAAAANYAA